MSVTKILTWVFLLISLGLAYFLFFRVKTDIDRADRIDEVEERVVEKLIMIREAQRVYQANKGQYTSDWSKLINFIDTGKIYLTQRKEEIIQLAYGADSVVVHIDTLGNIGVQDSLFSKIPGFRLEELPMIPESNGKNFAMYADKITKSGLTLDVVEVVDSAPYDRTRKEDNEARNRKPLRFGSRTDVTLAGNWE